MEEERLQGAQGHGGPPRVDAAEGAEQPLPLDGKGQPHVGLDVELVEDRGLAVHRQLGCRGGDVGPLPLHHPRTEAVGPAQHAVGCHVVPLADCVEDHPVLTDDTGDHPGPHGDVGLEELQGPSRRLLEVGRDGFGAHPRRDAEQRRRSIPEDLLHRSEQRVGARVLRHHRGGADPPCAFGELRFDAAAVHDHRHPDGLQDGLKGVHAVDVGQAEVDHDDIERATLQGKHLQRAEHRVDRRHVHTGGLELGGDQHLMGRVVLHEQDHGVGRSGGRRRRGMHGCS